MLPASVTISPPVFDAISAYGIGGLAVVVAVLWVFVLGQFDQRRVLILAVIAVVIMTVSAVAALSGALAQLRTFPPPMALMIAAVFVLGIAFGFSPIGRDAAAMIALPVLVGFQSFRLPLELVMHHAASVGIMPVELSYAGYNFDIVTGLGALALYLWSFSGRSVPQWVVWAWNLWGSYCLGVIAVIAIATSPMVRLFGDSPEHVNSWVLYFPYVWLPAVLVTIAIAGHVVIWRKLLSAVIPR